MRGRVRFTNHDRLFFIQLYRWFPSVLAMEIPLLGWPATNRCRPGALIRRMSVDNPLWGAPRIHGELLKLGFAVAQSTVANGMDRPCSRP